MRKREYLTLITKDVHPHYNLSGHMDPCWRFISAGNWNGEKNVPASVRGDPRGKKFCRENRNGELFLDREFFVAILSQR